MSTPLDPRSGQDPLLALLDAYATSHDAVPTARPVRRDPGAPGGGAGAHAAATVPGGAGRLRLASGCATRSRRWPAVGLRTRAVLGAGACPGARARAVDHHRRGRRRASLAPSASRRSCAGWARPRRACSRRPCPRMPRPRRGRRRRPRRRSSRSALAQRGAARWSVPVTRGITPTPRAPCRRTATAQHPRPRRLPTRRAPAPARMIDQGTSPPTPRAAGAPKPPADPTAKPTMTPRPTPAADAPAHPTPRPTPQPTRRPARTPEPERPSTPTDRRDRAPEKTERPEPIERPEPEKTERPEPTEQPRAREEQGGRDGGTDVSLPPAITDRRYPAV